MRREANLIVKHYIKVRLVKSILQVPKITSSIVNQNVRVTQLWLSLKTKYGNKQNKYWMSETFLLFWATLSLNQSTMDVVIIALLLYSQLCVEEKILTQLPF